MVYGMENSLTQAAAVNREPQSVQTQHTRSLAGKRPSRFDYQQSTGVFPVQETTRISSIYPYRMTADVLDIQRTWLWVPILANMWKLWLCRSWDSCCRRDRDEATENYPSPLLLIVHLLCKCFLFMWLTTWPTLQIKSKCTSYLIGMTYIMNI